MLQVKSTKPNNNFETLILLYFGCCTYLISTCRYICHVIGKQKKKKIAVIRNAGKSLAQTYNKLITSAKTVTPLFS